MRAPRWEKGRAPITTGPICHSLSCLLPVQAERGVLLTPRRPGLAAAGASPTTRGAAEAEEAMETELFSVSEGNRTRHGPSKSRC